jgi:hypothetical protein
MPLNYVQQAESTTTTTTLQEIKLKPPPNVAKKKSLKKLPNKAPVSGVPLPIPKKTHQNVENDSINPLQTKISHSEQ